MGIPASLIIRTPDGAERVVPLAAGSCSLGRAHDNDIAFPGHLQLSRRHLAFVPGPEGWSVQDLGSRNGTFLNGAAVRDASPLRAGDRITAGGLVIEFRSGAAGATDASAAESGGAIAARLDEILTGDGQAPLPLTSARHLQALLEAGAELAGRLPLDQLLPLILRLAANAVRAPRAVLMLDENGTLAERAALGSSFRISATVRDRVMRQRESLLIQDTGLEESLRLQASIVAQSVRSLLAVPLQTKDRAVGLLYLDSAGQAREFTREDLVLITVMGNMAAVAIENARLGEVEERERRVSLEMEQAAAIQHALLPSAPPALPGLDIAAFNRSCHQAGGDYHDFFRRAGGRLAVLVGDIAGKGMPAALLMASLQARVQVLMETEEDPARLMARLNRITAAHCPGNRFVTLFYADIDPASGAVEFVNAGHNPPLLLRSSGGVERLDAGGLLLGVFADSAYAAGRTRMAPGDTLLLYSDGVTEAAAPVSGEEFGEERLAAAAAAAAHLPAAEMIRRIVDAVGRFAGEVAAADDFTLLVLRKTSAE